MLFLWAHWYGKHPRSLHGPLSLYLHYSTYISMHLSIPIGGEVTQSCCGMLQWMVICAAGTGSSVLFSCSHLDGGGSSTRVSLHSYTAYAWVLYSCMCCYGTHTCVVMVLIHVLMWYSPNQKILMVLLYMCCHGNPTCIAMVQLHDCVAVVLQHVLPWCSYMCYHGTPTCVAMVVIHVIYIFQWQGAT